MSLAGLDTLRDPDSSGSSNTRKPLRRRLPSSLMYVEDLGPCRHVLGGAAGVPARPCDKMASPQWPYHSRQSPQAREPAGPHCGQL
jgi:hypothetical protein